MTAPAAARRGRLAAAGPAPGDRAVVTLAVGKPVYLEMAVNLARSFAWWHPDGGIRFAIATDIPEHLPPDLGAEIVRLEPGQFGTGFTPKLYLDQFAPAPRTLFIDADCLCVGSLEPVFARFAGHAASVVGGWMAEGEWFGDVQRTRTAFGLPALVKFNGGMYYLERGDAGRRVYERARAILPAYDSLGLVRLRGKPNEELLMAIALAAEGMRPVPDDGTILGDPQACPGPMDVDVLRGGARLTNPPPGDPLHQPWYPHREVRPVVVHFLADHTERLPYRREALRLRLAGGRGLPVWAADVAAALGRTLPLAAMAAARTAARPVYRRLFGTRRIAPSARV
ncbi:MAG TPA: hypothetical protein VNA89_15640 [Gemmatimonadaceae bacterium]|nr:hypothetical protein [Gemmatimonadaceae bacterium]